MLKVTVSECTMSTNLFVTRGTAVKMTYYNIMCCFDVSEKSWLVATLALSSDKTGSRGTGSALITWHSLLHSTEQQTDVNQCF